MCGVIGIFAIDSSFFPCAPLSPEQPTSVALMLRTLLYLVLPKMASRNDLTCLMEIHGGEISALHLDKLEYVSAFLNRALEDIQTGILDGRMDLTQ